VEISKKIFPSSLTCLFLPRVFYTWILSLLGRRDVFFPTTIKALGASSLEEGEVSENGEGEMIELAKKRKPENKPLNDWKNAYKKRKK